MPFRIAVAKELAELCKVIAHPDRIRLVEELHAKERQDVNTLAESLGIPGARVSQHLALLRAHRYVEEERIGRHHYYSLIQPALAQWLLGGLEFIEIRSVSVSSDDIDQARQAWSSKKTHKS